MPQKSRLTRDEAYVLYQIKDEIGNPEEIADILEGLGRKDVEKVLTSLKRKKLIEAAGKNDARITEKGKETMKKNKKLIFK